MKPAPIDRRTRKRTRHSEGRRRYPRLHLDVDWFMETRGLSTFGRGLEISPRGARLPIGTTRPPEDEVTLHLALPPRARMFRARGVVIPASFQRGWIIRFTDVPEADLRLLALVLIEEYGLWALPGLERKFQRNSEVPGQYLRA